MTAPAPLLFEGVPLGRREAAPLTLAVPAHAAVALLGDEDSGLGRLGGYALGLERPPGGRATVFGTTIADLPERERLAFRRRVGYLPAGDGLLQNLSLRNNVALPLRFGSEASPKEIDGRVNVMLVAARVTSAANLRPAQANDEERRRAAFARALAFDPALLILERVRQRQGGIGCHGSGQLTGRHADLALLKAVRQRDSLRSDGVGRSSQRGRCRAQ